MRISLLAALILGMLSHASASTRFRLLDDQQSSTLNGDGVESYKLSPSGGGGAVTISKNTSVGPVTPPSSSTQFTVNTLLNDRTSFVSDPLSAVSLTGYAKFHIGASEQTTTANASLTAELYRVSSDGTSIISTIAAARLNGPELTTTFATQEWNVLMTNVSLTNGQRLAVRLFYDDGSGVTVSSSTVYALFNDSTSGAVGESYVEIPQSMTTFGTSTPTPTLTLTPTVTSIPSATHTPTVPAPSHPVYKSAMLYSGELSGDNSFICNNTQLYPPAGQILNIVTIFSSRLDENNTTFIVDFYWVVAPCTIGTNGTASDLWPAVGDGLQFSISRYVGAPLPQTSELHVNWTGFGTSMGAIDRGLGMTMVPSGGLTLVVTYYLTDAQGNYVP
jgi:hypothetical protein